MSKKLFTSESVTEGHPDKIADLIADKILDELIKQDPSSRCACEVTVQKGAVHIMGEISSTAHVDYESVARETIAEIGYLDDELGFSVNSVIHVSLNKQSSDIALGVDDSWETKNLDKSELGAGDQGIMFGFASNETKEYMPLAATYAHKLSKQLTKVRKEGILDYLRPDGKTQVTIEYTDGYPTRVEAIVVSAQHTAEVTIERLRSDIRKEVIDPIVPSELMDSKTKIFINPTGRFVIGGPAGDTGLTGRKIIADTYGGYAHHGGGAFSGKDATKVDRSAAYMMRYLAKNIVASGIASQCEIQVGYAIGVANPVSIMVDTFGTSKVKNEVLEDWIRDKVDLRPQSIIDTLGLREPIYASTTNYCHFGGNHSWEQLSEELIKSIQALKE